jgi:alkylation response protein AidB-like acyl-CoA dehydrogenase
MNQEVYKGLDAESRQMVVDTVRQLRKKLLTKETVLEWDKHEVFPEDAIREMLGPEVGLQLLFIPEEYGGMGGGARDCCARLLCCNPGNGQNMPGDWNRIFRHPAGLGPDSGGRHE